LTRVTQGGDLEGGDVDRGSAAVGGGGGDLRAVGNELVERRGEAVDLVALVWREAELLRCVITVFTRSGEGRR
jgi:hypothetical protein